MHIAKNKCKDPISKAKLRKETSSLPFMFIHCKLHSAGAFAIARDLFEQLFTLLYTNLLPPTMHIDIPIPRSNFLHLIYLPNKIKQISKSVNPIN